MQDTDTVCFRRKAHAAQIHPVGQTGKLIQRDDRAVRQRLRQRFAGAKALRQLIEENSGPAGGAQTADALGLTQVKISREEKKIFSRLREELA